MLGATSHSMGLGATNHSYGLGATSHSMGLGANSHSMGLGGSCVSHCMGLGATSHSMGLGNANFWPAWLLPAVAGGVAVGAFLHFRDKRASRPVSGLGRGHYRLRRFR